MDSLMSLGAPLKQFTSYVSGTKNTKKRGSKGSQSVRRFSVTRRKSVGRRRSLPCNSQKVPDSWLRVYQEELKKERLFARQTGLNKDKAVRYLNKLLAHVLRLMWLCAVCQRKRQQAILAKKNAERTVRGTHFRSHHCLPRHTPAARKPAPTKDDSFFGAFQGLSLDGLTGGAAGSPTVSASAAGGEQCNVM